MDNDTERTWLVLPPFSHGQGAPQLVHAPPPQVVHEVVRVVHEVVHEVVQVVHGVVQVVHAPPHEVVHEVVQVVHAPPPRWCMRWCRWCMHHLEKRKKKQSQIVKMSRKNILSIVLEGDG